MIKMQTAATSKYSLDLVPLSLTKITGACTPGKFINPRRWFIRVFSETSVLLCKAGLLIEVFDRRLFGVDSGRRDATMPRSDADELFGRLASISRRIGLSRNGGLSCWGSRAVLRHD